MSALDSIKHAPRWTWYVVGGVGIGAAAIKVWKGRDTTPADSTATNAGTAADAYPGTGMPATTGSSPPGVIVPPIVMGNDGGSASDLGAAFAGLVGGTITDLTGLVGMSIDANAATTQTWIGALSQSNTQFIDALANAGSAPQPVMVNPTPVNISIAPPPSPAVAAPPRVTPAAPAAPQHPWGNGPDPCTGDFPYYQDEGPRKGQCYNTFYKDNKHYKRYKNGDVVAY